MVLAQCQVHQEKFASKGDLVGTAAMLLFQKIE
jgi:hypothetical protein